MQVSKMCRFCGILGGLIWEFVLYFENFKNTYCRNYFQKMMSKYSRGDLSPQKQLYYLQQYLNLTFVFPVHWLHAECIIFPSSAQIRLVLWTYKSFAQHQVEVWPEAYTWPSKKIKWAIWVSDKKKFSGPTNLI